MKTQGNCETVRMKRIQLYRPEFQRLSVDCSRKKIDRIPDAFGFQYAVRAGEGRHRYAPGKSALHARRNWIGVNRKPGALVRWNGNPLNHAPLSRDPNIFGNDRHGLL